MKVPKLFSVKFAIIFAFYSMEYDRSKYLESILLLIPEYAHNLFIYILLRWILLSNTPQNLLQQLLLSCDPTLLKYCVFWAQSIVCFCIIKVFQMKMDSCADHTRLKPFPHKTTGQGPSEGYTDAGWGLEIKNIVQDLNQILELHKCQWFRYCIHLQCHEYQALNNGHV